VNHDLVPLSRSLNICVGLSLTVFSFLSAFYLDIPMSALTLHSEFWKSIDVLFLFLISHVST
jgi:hypothetical protein